MKHYLVGIVLALSLILAVGSASLAAPFTAGEAGSWSAFGEYGNLMLIAPMYGFTIGAGYGISDNLAIGLEAELYGGDALFGGFANWSLGSVNINGEVLTAGGDFNAKIKALYMFNLDAVKVGVGGGTYFASSGSGSLPLYAEVAGNYGLGDNLAIYGAIDYFISPSVPWSVYNFGVAYTF